MNDNGSQIKQIKQQIHQMIDPVWQSGVMSRGRIYERLSRATGLDDFHNRTLRDMRIGRKALAEATKIYYEAYQTTMLGVK